VPALPFVADLLGWTKPKSGKPSQPNMADGSSKTSVAIATELLDALAITQQVEHVGQTAGRRLEKAVEQHLSDVLPQTISQVLRRVSRRAPITRFSQYEHLETLEGLIESDDTMTLKASIGTDYVIKPDVTALGSGAKREARGGDSHPSPSWTTPSHHPGDRGAPTDPARVACKGDRGGRCPLPRGPR
jgi:hypothetical protein